MKDFIPILIVCFLSPFSLGANRKEARCKTIVKALAEFAQFDSLPDYYLLKTFRGRNLSEQESNNLIKVIKNIRKDPRAPEKLARAVRIRALTHATGNAIPLLRSGKIIAGDAVPEKDQNEIQLGETYGTYLYDKVFLMPLSDRANKSKIPNKWHHTLVLDVSALNRPDCEINSVQSYGQAGSTLKNGPVDFVYRLTNAGAGEAMFKSLPIWPYLKAIVVHKPLAGYNPKAELLTDIKKARLRPPKGKSWEDLIIETNHFRDIE